MSRYVGHPDDESLVRMARGEEQGSESERISAHVAACADCVARLRDIQSMRALFADAPVMPAPDAVLAEALERRARQERVLLAHESPRAEATASVAWRRLTPLAIAASVAIAAFTLWPRGETPAVAERARVADSSIAPKAPPPPASDNALGALSPWPLVAYAQSASDVLEVPYPAITVFDTTAVQSGTRRYVRSSASPYHDYMPIGAEAIELRDTTYDGVRVWRVVTSAPLEASIMTDTAWIRRADMRMIARHIKIFSNTTRQRLLRGDTVLEQQHVIRLPVEVQGKIDPSKLRHTSHTAIRPGQLLVTDRSYFHLLVRSLPLHPTWKGSIDVNLGRSGNFSPMIFQKTRSINVSVQGDSVVSTLWGNIPSWRVVLHTGPTPERWYVSKAGHEVLLVTGPYAMAWPRNRFDLIGRYVK